MRIKHIEDGWLVFVDGDREVIRIKLPPGGISIAELEAFKRHLIAHMHGAN